MKNVKMILAAMLVMTFAANPSFAQEKKKAKMEMKEHKCTASCKGGEHMYACGEKGHTCTKECKKEMKKENKTEKKG